MSSVFLSNLIAFVVVFLYASFFEWAFHKYLFHSPKFIKATYKAHQLIHHQRYRYDTSSYEWQEGQEKDHISMNWFALPLFLAVHIGPFFLVQLLVGQQIIWGGCAAVTAYYIVYEYFHYCMHVPASRAFERLKAFTFAKEHHRIHHLYMQQNLNVFFPLADICLGTFVSPANAEARKAPRAASVPVRPTGS